MPPDRPVRIAGASGGFTDRVAAIFRFAQDPTIDGFFTRHDNEYEWLRRLLTIAKLKELLGPEEYSGGRVDRFEMRNVRVVHFLLRNHLDRGYNSGSKLDTLAKNLCEYLRAKVVDVPNIFLDRGRV